MEQSKEKDSNDESNKSFFNFDPISWIFIAISGLLLIFSFFAPLLLNKTSKIETFNSTSNELGDSLGGMMTPFIAIAGVLMTFLAFYIQYKANEAQKERLNKEIKSRKTENSKNEIERRFFEMLKLHKENVNELELSWESNLELNKSVKGRNVFKYYLNEIELIYNILKQLSPNEFERNLMVHSYFIFFIGNNLQNSEYNLFKDIRKNQKANPIAFREEIINRINKDGNKCLDFYKFETIFFYKVFTGHSASLSHYFRHLFQTVKYIVEQNESIISYEDKRNYLRILRSQLSNEEQTLLYYNWISGFGGKWEDNQNHYFTDYRMIHNLIFSKLIIAFDFSFFQSIDYKKENEKKTDPLFENDEF